MGPVITNQPNTQELVSCEKREKRKPKMCNTHQQNPQQNQPWQGVYPDLSALNELFSPQAAVNSETSSSSPWIAFLSSLGLQPIPGVRVRVTTNHLRVLHSLPHNPMVTPADTPVAPP